MVELRVGKRRQGDVTVVSAEGEIDMATRLKLSTSLVELVDDDDGRPVVLDLGATRFIDSSGLGILLNALRRLTRQGRRMTIACPNGCAVYRVIELAGLNGTFEIHTTMDGAIEAAKVPLPKDEAYAIRR